MKVRITKMPKAKEETVKEYVVVAKLDLTKTKVDVDPSTMSAFFNIANNTIYVNPNYVSYLISEGIIAEKKSDKEIVAERAAKAIYNDGVIMPSTGRMAQIILEELEKAGVK